MQPPRLRLRLFRRRIWQQGARRCIEGAKLPEWGCQEALREIGATSGHHNTNSSHPVVGMLEGVGIESWMTWGLLGWKVPASDNQ